MKIESQQIPFDLSHFKEAYEDNPQAFCIVYVSRDQNQYKDITFIYVNRAYEQMSGFSLKSLIGHNYTEIIGEPSDQWNNIYGNVAYHGGAQSLIVPGPEIDAYVSIQCFQIAPGYCGSNVLDVTREVRTAKRAQRENEESWKRMEEERSMYQTLLNQSSAMITVIDAENYEVLYANAAACEVTKDMEQGYVGSTCYESISHRSNPCVDCILTRKNAPAEEVREIPFANRTYRMVYKYIAWNGRKALMEYSEDITEQKKVMQLMEENTKIQEGIIENLPTGIIVYKIENQRYQVMQVNPAACSMMGITSRDIAQAMGADILKFVVEADREMVCHAAEQMRNSTESVHFEFRCKSQGIQKQIWIEAEGRSALQADGSVYVYVGYKDITDSKNRELEFQQKVSFISNLDDDKLISKGRHNLSKNRILDMRAKKGGAVPGKSGGSYEALLPLLRQTAVTDEEKERLQQILNRESLLQAFSDGKREFSIDYRRKMEENQIIWATLKGALYEEPATHDVIAFLYSYDSTEQIQESQIVTRLSTLEYGLLGLIDIRTGQYKTVYMLGVEEKQYQNMHGDYDTMIAQRCRASAIQENRSSLLDKMRLKTVKKELENRTIYELDYSTLNADGTQKRIRFHYSFLDETKETIIYFSSDITENYQREQAQIHKIERALQQAQDANCAKSAFFSRMSHDMRTPMNGILGMTSLSEQENDQEILKSNMRKIQESGEYLLSLINDTLDVQRIESGRMKLEPKLIGAMEMIENILDMVRTAAETKGVNLRFDAKKADLSGYVRVDSVRVKQVFVNLLSNAVKFTPSGGTVEFEVRLLQRADMISHYMFIVRDTGIGMSREFLENRIFQPFSQENNQVTANYAGSGLGLSIARSLVEMMGGRIEVVSELGVGSTFTVYLDLESVDRMEVQQIQQRQHRDKDSFLTLLAGKHILLAEDHPLNAEITQKLLQKVGCSVVWAKDGSECLSLLQKAEKGQYDLVLMDVRMPVMDGMEATRMIRKMNRAELRDIPIIAMTANAYSDDVEHCMEAGMNAHLAKPIEPSQMYEMMVRYLK